MLGRSCIMCLEFTQDLYSYNFNNKNYYGNSTQSIHDVFDIWL